MPDDVKYPWSHNSTVQEGAEVWETIFRRLAQFMREEGIEEFTGPVPDVSGGVCVKLCPPLLRQQNIVYEGTPPANPRFDLPAETPQVDGPQRVGSDGLTLEQQLDLYGRPMDSFKPKPEGE